MADHERFHNWADAVSGIAAGSTGETVERAWAEFSGFLTEVIAAKRARPGDDLLSLVVAARDADDGRLDDEELVMSALALVAGGYLTVANALSIGVVAIAQAGGFSALTKPAAATLAAEEVLRFQIGLSGEAFPRWAREGVQLAMC